MSDRNPNPKMPVHQLEMLITIAEGMNKLIALDDPNAAYKGETTLLKAAAMFPDLTPEELTKLRKVEELTGNLSLSGKVIVQTVSEARRKK